MSDFPNHVLAGQRLCPSVWFRSMITCVFIETSEHMIKVLKMFRFYLLTSGWLHSPYQQRYLAHPFPFLWTRSINPVGVCHIPDRRSLANGSRFDDERPCAGDRFDVATSLSDLTWLPTNCRNAVTWGEQFPCDPRRRGFDEKKSVSNLLKIWPVVLLRFVLSFAPVRPNSWHKFWGMSVTLRGYEDKRKWKGFKPTIKLLLSLAIVGALSRSRCWFVYFLSFIIILAVPLHSCNAYALYMRLIKSP